MLASVFNVTLFIYMARALGVESFGYLSYATTFVLYLFNFIDLGLSTYGTREVAKDRSRLSEYVSNILSFKLLLSIAIFSVFVLGVWLSPQIFLIKALMIELALLLFISSLATEWAFQGMEKMHMVFASLVTTAFLQLLLTVIFVKGPQDVLKAPIASLAASIPILILFLTILGFRMKIRSLDVGSIKTYLSSSLAIWAISAFAQVYNSLDIVMLGFFRPPEDVGYFTVARRFVGGSALVIMVLATAVMPHLSAAFVRDKARFHAATVKFFKIGVFVILSIFLPLIMFAKPIISLMVGAQYAQAAPPLQIMMAALILVMFNVPFSTGLIAAGFEKSVLKQAFSSAALSIVSNFILMPKYGMIGASVSFVLAESLALIWILCLYRSKIRKG